MSIEAFGNLFQPQLAGAVTSSLDAVVSGLDATTRVGAALPPENLAALVPAEALRVPGESAGVAEAAGFPGPADFLGAFPGSDPIPMPKPLQPHRETLVPLPDLRQALEDPGFKIGAGLNAFAGGFLGEMGIVNRLLGEGGLLEPLLGGLQPPPDPSQASPPASGDAALPGTHLPDSDARRIIFSPDTDGAGAKLEDRAIIIVSGSAGREVNVKDNLGERSIAYAPFEDRAGQEAAETAQAEGREVNVKDNLDRRAIRYAPFEARAGQELAEAGQGEGREVNVKDNLDRRAIRYAPFEDRAGQELADAAQIAGREVNVKDHQGERFILEGSLEGQAAGREVNVKDHPGERFVIDHPLEGQAAGREVNVKDAGLAEPGGAPTVNRLRIGDLASDTAFLSHVFAGIDTARESFAGQTEPWSPEGQGQMAVLGYQVLALHQMEGSVHEALSLQTQLGGFLGSRIPG